MPFGVNPSESRDQRRRDKSSRRLSSLWIDCAIFALLSSAGIKRKETFLWVGRKIFCLQFFPFLLPSSNWWIDLKAHRERNWFVSIESARLYYITVGGISKGADRNLFFSFSIFNRRFMMKNEEIPYRRRPLRPAHSAFRTFVVLFHLKRRAHILPHIFPSLHPPFVLSMTRWHFMVGRAFSLIVARLLWI